MRDDEFERLYAEEAAGLFSFLAYRTGDRALAEDLLADAFEAARARALERAGTPGEEAPSALGAVEERDAVQRALATLSADEREAIALRFGADLTVPEIATVLRQPLSRVEGRVYRALRKLRDVLPER